MAESKLNMLTGFQHLHHGLGVRRHLAMSTTAGRGVQRKEFPWDVNRTVWPWLEIRILCARGLAILASASHVHAPGLFVA